MRRTLRVSLIVRRLGWQRTDMLVVTDLDGADWASADTLLVNRAG